MDYKDWTKEALIERLQSLDKLVSHKTETDPEVLSVPSVSAANATSATDTSMAECEGAEVLGSVEQASPRRKKHAAKFDFADFPKRKVALKFGYFGWAYHGLARQGNALESEEKRQVEKQFPTIEGEIFRALFTCRLVEDESSCGYSRCGRTDRGVSGFGQVIALHVRSAGQYISDEEAAAELAKGTDASLITRDEQNGGKLVLLPSPDRELPYVNMINKCLPPAVRILAWSPVKLDFDARFSCKERFYRYFFSQEGLDIGAMKEAAKRYVGTHDFRNFCRLDAAKQICNFERQVLDIAINPVPPQVPFVGDGLNAEGKWWQLELRGTAFLWHQVRCMMAILFHVGQGLEDPSVVDRLLDVQSTPGKPEYEMASDIPLVLANCVFDSADVQWIHMRDPGLDYGHLVNLDRAILNQWGQLNTQAVIASALLQSLRSTAVAMPNKTRDASAVSIQPEMGPWAVCREQIIQSEKASKLNLKLGGGYIKHLRQYVPIMQRKRADPVDLRNKTWLARKNNSKRAKMAPKLE
ncbi:pseudouridine synthase deg1 [Coemansia sp. RSA 2320]|nr:pseudouridine synthase deg1 [Coemansia sp. RSA 2320]